MIRIRDLTKSFGARVVLDGLAAHASEGSVVGIVGASGSGKTTLLRCLVSLEPFEGGSIEVARHVLRPAGSGERLEKLINDVGMVFQDYQLFPHLSVLENLTLAPRIVQRLCRVDAELLGMRLLAKVGLQDRAGSKPNELSGGEKQRVALVRALALEPKVLLLDEPTSALDADLRADVRAALVELVQMRRKIGTPLTVVVVTHDLWLAREFAEELWLLDRGRIVKRGAPDIVLGHFRAN
jgi:ABC-type polar amino acid transport system ATPase subunit